MFFTFISITAIWPDSGKDHDAGLTSADLKLEEKIEKDSTTDSSITTYTFVNASEETTFVIDRGYAALSARPCVQQRVCNPTGGNPVK